MNIVWILMKKLDKWNLGQEYSIPIIFELDASAKTFWSWFFLIYEISKFEVKANFERPSVWLIRHQLLSSILILVHHDFYCISLVIHQHLLFPTDIMQWIPKN